MKKTISLLLLLCLSCTTGAVLAMGKNQLPDEEKAGIWTKWRNKSYTEKKIELPKNLVLSNIPTTFYTTIDAKQHLFLIETIDIYNQSEQHILNTKTNQWEKKQELAPMQKPGQRTVFNTKHLTNSPNPELQTISLYQENHSTKNIRSKKNLGCTIIEKKFNINPKTTIFSPSHISAGTYVNNDSQENGLNTGSICLFTAHPKVTPSHALTKLGTYTFTRQNNPGNIVESTHPKLAINNNGTVILVGFPGEKIIHIYKVAYEPIAITDTLDAFGDVLITCEK